MDRVTSSLIPVLKLDSSVTGGAPQIKPASKFNYINRTINTMFIDSGLIVDGFFLY